MYGDNGMITQNWKDQQKGEGPILGNAKVFWSDGGSMPQKKSQASDQPTQYQQNNAPPSGAGGAHDDFDDDIPFMRLHWMEGG
jgi:single-stranded DNA-binding protein